MVELSLARGPSPEVLPQLMVDAEGDRGRSINERLDFSWVAKPPHARHSNREARWSQCLQGSDECGDMREVEDAAGPQAELEKFLGVGNGEASSEHQVKLTASHSFLKTALRIFDLSSAGVS